MKYIKIWESFDPQFWGSFDPQLIKIEAGPSHRAGGYTFVFANGWMGDEQIFSALSGPFWGESDGMGYLYYALPDNDPKVAYVLVVEFPEKFKKKFLSVPVVQKLADYLGREIRNPAEDSKLAALTAINKSFVFWERRGSLPFYPSRDR